MPWGQSPKAEPAEQESKKGGKQPATIVRLGIEDIEIRADRAKAVNEEEAHRIAHSFTKVGQMSPVTIREYRKKSADGEPRTRLVLNEGYHRFRAAQILGWKKLDAVVIPMTSELAELREIAENVFRNTQTPFERAEQVCRWIALTGQDGEEGAQDAHPGGQQPHDKGVSRAARELNLSRDEVRRSKTIGMSIAEEVKQRIRETKVDLSQQALLELAKKPQQEQIDSIERLVDPGKKKQKGGTGKDKSGVIGGSADAEAQFLLLKDAWTKARAVRAVWDRCSPEVRNRFTIEILQVAASTVGGHGE